VSDSDIQPRQTAGDHKTGTHVPAKPGHRFGFTSLQSELFARITFDEHYEYWPLLSERFRRWLEHELCLMGGVFPPFSFVKEILRQLEGMAMFLGQTRPVYLRVAGHADKL